MWIPNEVDSDGTTLNYTDSFLASRHRRPWTASNST
jgi:hypothetical protein